MNGPPLSRRRALVLAALASASMFGCGTNDRTMVRLASGEDGGFYYAFAGLLAATAESESDVIRIEPLETAGSQQNLRMLADGEVDTALALADSAGDDGGRVVALGRVYENYLQLAVRTEGPIHEVSELRGRRVNLGAEGSGAAVTGRRLLATAGLDPATDVTVEHRPLREAAQALTDGTIDALLWAGGVPTGALTVPDPMRLVDLGALAGPMRDRYGPVYDRVAIPADAYPGSPAVHTIGVANLLLAAATLPDEAAAAIVELLVWHADALVPAEAAGTQFLDGRFLIGTGTVPLHPGAAEVYRRWHG
ncbi:TAXI family TRAP transporter solute-binding subunit [Nocardia cyriacigeorgica]|uniref:TAXI family TRAP transporter solute-binding subunit n=1 Tax=Nocardia cyriacigeorgica TaxID=135487 RepID=A0A6P1D9U1_9NOCA|nr:TAXI family TRAP transporter solute-binding subunit [Nocardia cyriacigeorgica]NEW39080.1 TAXI family TRAP transporter solute-binding subunit [Nocardia cyriacigeorgica]NEW47465.1 TAXI family TRAP transporter solute-binding subunit [Nocardia cyriacigeorgica]NEW52716.1 TAXI family TRAP transporter solute-binding subunit [Nocardia cyriacigeorgica]NEW57356.1 TAXI family TRAP transporter solute-binding subunit [Nocardia cyriacigeorgica]